MLNQQGRIWILLVTLVLGLAVAAGCTEASTSAPEETSAAPSSNTTAKLIESPEILDHDVSVVSGARSVTSGQSGIWVSGLGKITVEPDLAVLNLGVEARETKVSVARSKAAEAMNQVIATLKTHGINDLDIRTEVFNIQPITVYKEKFLNGERYNEAEIVGYKVTNQITVNVRNMEKIGVIVDESAAVAANLIRVNGISFTVEETRPYTIKAREAAVQDALSKAQQFADLTNIRVGPLLYITETSGTPAPYMYESSGRAMLSAMDSYTPVSGGQIDITVSVQAAFAIL
jgi:uncharacterized protein YggE